MERWKSTSLVNGKSEHMSNFFLIPLTNAASLFAITTQPKDILVLTSFLTGILLISWFFYIIQSPISVARLSNNLLGVSALALLSTHSIVVQWLVLFYW